MSGKSPLYEIRLRGHLDARRARQFAGLTITLLPQGDTLLCGPVADQAALHGILNRIRDLGMSLVYVQQTEPLDDDGNTETTDAQA